MGGGARAKYNADGSGWTNIYGTTVGAPSLYMMPALSNTTAHIGSFTVNTKTSGATIRLHLCFSAGYNGALNQMLDTYVNFCWGNGSGTLYNCWVDYKPVYNTTFQVKYKVSGYTVDFYVVATTYFGQGYYIASYAPEYGTWMHSGTSVSTPSDLISPTMIGKEVVLSSTEPTVPDCLIWVQV